MVVANGTTDSYIGGIFGIKSDALRRFIGLGIKIVEFTEAFMMIELLLARAAMCVGLIAPSIQTLLLSPVLFVIPAVVLWGVVSNDNGGCSVEDLTISLDGLGDDRGGRSAQLVQ
jgi:hypothetical protein